MAEKHGADRFNWILPIYAAAASIAIFVPISVYSSQWGTMLYLFGAVPLISLVLLSFAIVSAVRRKPRQTLAITAALCVTWVMSWVLVSNQIIIRSEVRWLGNSAAYKAQVMAQPAPRDGQLRHIEWDGWGFPGAGDTVVYLVFDPDDSLASAIRKHASGKFDGIPCDIPTLHRLEKHWYMALFYTDTDWNHCA